MPSPERPHDDPRWPETPGLAGAMARMTGAETAVELARSRRERGAALEKAHAELGRAAFDALWTDPSSASGLPDRVALALGRVRALR